MPIIMLTGPKHCGKTAAGRALADLTGLPFTDLDELVERREGKSPRELYRLGADVFRRAEAAALETLLPAGGGVAAAGGGLIGNAAAMEMLAGASDRIVTVYLDLPAAEAWKRIEAEAADKGLPPFLEGPDPRESHRLLHERRAAAYRAAARYVVPVEGETPEAIAYTILQLVKKRDAV